MKQYISHEHLNTISGPVLAQILAWWQKRIAYDDTVVCVHIVEEKTTYKGRWDQEYSFDYPGEYIGKLKNHQGTMLPLLSIGEMIEFIDAHLGGSWWHIEHAGDVIGWRVQSRHFDEEGKLELIDALWEAAKVLLEVRVDER